jgi:hypothetical protein
MDENPYRAPQSAEAFMPPKEMLARWEAIEYGDGLPKARRIARYLSLAAFVIRPEIEQGQLLRGCPTAIGMPTARSPAVGLGYNGRMKRILSHLYGITVTAVFAVSLFSFADGNSSIPLPQYVWLGIAVVALIAILPYTRWVQIDRAVRTRRR